MKQHITKEQLNELSDKEKTVLIKWLKKHNYYNLYATSEGRLLSIGLMIELLYSCRDRRADKLLIGRAGVSLPIHSEYSDIWIGEDFCDELWQAVKEILNEKEKN